MPLSTQVIRNGEPLKISWGSFHVAAMALAASFDARMPPFTDPSVIYITPPGTFDDYPNEAFPITNEVAFTLVSYGVLAQTPLNEGSYTLKSKHHFTDVTDGEDFVLLPGDELIAYRQ